MQDLGNLRITIEKKKHTYTEKNDSLNFYNTETFFINKICRYFSQENILPKYSPDKYLIFNLILH